MVVLVGYFWLGTEGAIASSVPLQVHTVCAAVLKAHSCRQLSLAFA